MNALKNDQDLVLCVQASPFALLCLVLMNAFVMIPCSF